MIRMIQNVFNIRASMPRSHARQGMDIQNAYIAIPLIESMCLSSIRDISMAAHIKEALVNDDNDNDNDDIREALVKDVVLGWE